MRHLLLASALFLSVPALAQAAELNGTWERANGRSRITFAPCTSGICGHISWLKPGIPPTTAKIGDRVFYNLVRASDASWTGKAFNPEDGKTYSGQVSYQGAKLLTKGCVLGGLICKSETWTKID